MSDRGEIRPSTLIALGVVAALVPWIAAALLSLGPLVWTVLGWTFVAGGVAKSLFGSSGDEPERCAERDDRTGPDRINCRNCGARADADADRCPYCERPLA